MIKISANYRYARESFRVSGLFPYHERLKQLDTGETTRLSFKISTDIF
ncbi:MAG: hypothetical protein ACREBQ_02225 [Nitrososphaerales archaeon]